MILSAYKLYLCNAQKYYYKVNGKHVLSKFRILCIVFIELSSLKLFFFRNYLYAMISSSNSN